MSAPGKRSLIELDLRPKTAVTALPEQDLWLDCPIFISRQQPHNQPLMHQNQPVMHQHLQPLNNQPLTEESDVSRRSPTMSQDISLPDLLQQLQLTNLQTSLTNLNSPHQQLEIQSESFRPKRINSHRVEQQEDLKSSLQHRENPGEHERHLPPGSENQADGDTAISVPEGMRVEWRSPSGELVTDNNSNASVLTNGTLYIKKVRQMGSVCETNRNRMCKANRLRMCEAHR